MIHVVDQHTYDAIAAAAAAFGVTPDWVIDGGRQEPQVWARHVARWLVRTRGLSYPRVAAIWGCDHTTVINSCRQVEVRRRDDHAFDLKVNRIVERLGGAP